jgi:hypothetical protein
MIYTTDAVESLNAKLRRSVRVFALISQAVSDDEIDLAAIARNHSEVEDASTRMGRGQSAVLMASGGQMEFAHVQARFVRPERHRRFVAFEFGVFASAQRLLDKLHSEFDERWCERDYNTWLKLHPWLTSTTIRTYGRVRMVVSRSRGRLRPA